MAHVLGFFNHSSPIPLFLSYPLPTFPTPVVKSQPTHAPSPGHSQASGLAPFTARLPPPIPPTSASASPSPRANRAFLPARATVRYLPCPVCWRVPEVGTCAHGGSPVCRDHGCPDPAPAPTARVPSPTAALASTLTSHGWPLRLRRPRCRALPPAPPLLLSSPNMRTPRRSSHSLPRCRG